MIKDEKPLDLEVVEAGGLLHDIGILKCQGNLFSIQEYPIPLQLPEDIIIHVAAGGRIAEDLGFPESIVKVVLRHDFGTPSWLLTKDECAQLGVRSLLEEDYVPKTWNEKAVMYSDFLMFMRKVGFDPWGAPDSPYNAAFPYIDFSLRKRTGSGATRENAIMQRVLGFHSELKKYASANFLKG